MVRFAKNGSDVTSAAVRLARAYSKKENILICGYHGWHDWYIASTSKNLGVPKSQESLCHKFHYNDINSLKKAYEDASKNVAAIIMEPMTTELPKKGFLQEIRHFTSKNNIVLIFDEK